MVELPNLSETLSAIADAKSIIGISTGGLALLSVSGAIPKVGFVRSLTLGWRSFFRKTYPLSVRKTDINLLNDSVNSLEKGSYITVTGGKGNGKSCLIDTCLNRHFGVIKISVSCLLSHHPNSISFDI